MTTTMGQLTAQILTDTNRDGSMVDPNYTYLGQPVPLYPAAIQRAILTSIKYMESRYYWMFRKMAIVTIPEGLNVTELPADLINIDYVQYNWNGNIYSPKNRFIPVSFQDLQNLFYSTGQVGQPTRWAIWTNLFYVYPYVGSDQDFEIWYYNKDLVYPTVDGQTSNPTTSIWFNDATVDLVRMMAMQRFYYDTLQAPDIGNQYTEQVDMFQRNLDMKNNNRQTNNFLSW